MIVIDASILANAVGDDGGDGQRARELLSREPSLAAPDLVDVETTAVLRRRWLHRDLTDERFEHAVGDLLDLAITRFPSGPLMRRAFDLRANVSAYDAAYVALAETLQCPLHTADRRLARAVGPTCPIVVLNPG